MKFTSAILAVCASLSMTAVADNCFKGWMYCGWDLMDKGDYGDYIIDKLEQAGLYGLPEKDRMDALFFCQDDGEADFKRMCPGGCAWGGKQKNDYCA